MLAIIVIVCFALAGALLLAGCQVFMAGCEYEVKTVAKCEAQRG